MKVSALPAGTLSFSNVFCHCEPILVFLMYGERLTWRQAAGITISLAGVITIISRADWAGLAALRFLTGDLWMLIAVVFWAFYSVMLRRRPAELPAMPFIGATTIIGVIALLPFYAWEFSVAGGFALNQENVLSIAYFAIFPSILSFMFWSRGMAEVGATWPGGGGKRSQSP